MKRHVRRTAKLIFFLLLIGGSAFAEVKELERGGFVINQEYVLPGTPESVYDAVTGDISPWWDHKFNPSSIKLYLEPKPGGGFWEIFDNAGNGALHATVIYADRGKRLTFVGPLGLNGMAVDCVTTYTFTPDPGGARLHLTVKCTGEKVDGEEGVDQVWRHFLFERLKPYLEAKHKPSSPPSADPKPQGAHAPRQYPHVSNTSFLSPTGERVLREEVILDAPLQAAWESMTTSAGLKTFVAPTVEVELRTGGKFHANYRVGSSLSDPDTIRNTVLNYVPLEMFSIKIGLTQQFPQALRDADSLFAVLTFQELGPGKTRVTETMVGWQQGPEWDQTYAFFERGNAYTLEKMYERFKNGPAQWTANNEVKRNPQADQEKSR